MLTVQVLPMNMLEENCYIISDETREAVIVDCGALSNEDRKKITRYVSSQQLTLKHHICTHMHYDHCFGVAFIKETYQLSPEFHQADEAIYKGMGDEIFGALRKLMQDGLTPEAGKYLHEGDDISFGTHTLRVLETPGHTPGGICFYCEPEKALFRAIHCSMEASDARTSPGEMLHNCTKASVTGFSPYQTMLWYTPDMGQKPKLVLRNSTTRTYNPVRYRNYLSEEVRLSRKSIPEGV